MMLSSKGSVGACTPTGVSAFLLCAFTAHQGDEINVNLEHWKTVRPEAPPSYASELVNNLYFCTPDRCVERIAALQSQHGIAYFGAAFSFGTMAHAKVMASMKLFADQVMPKFR